ncbi:hypothetical protein H5410_023557 [Solanum commersonii]|uniref:Uncharacterized protein n=1 Tax=Solanum commersonii TaxID=4109 RepID=A0A9J5ZJQ7_SOLCO|nr:hypothetical protein H5410_023557 [Solanum commersonii]
MLGKEANIYYLVCPSPSSKYLLWLEDLNPLRLLIMVWKCNILQVIFIICRELNVGDMKDRILLTFSNHVAMWKHSDQKIKLTPRYFIEKRRMDKAKVVLGRIRTSGVEVELQDLTTLIEREYKRQ